MNILAIALALLGTCILFGGLFLAKSFQSKLAKAAIRIFSVLLSLMAIPMLAMALQASTQTTAEAGKYWFYFLIVGSALYLFIGRRKSAAQ